MAGEGGPIEDVAVEGISSQLIASAWRETVLSNRVPGTTTNNALRRGKILA